MATAGSVRSTCSQSSRITKATGIGTALTAFALAWIKNAGVGIAMVGTGADPGHAPARRTYEKAGMHLVPMARYFKKL